MSQCSNSFRDALASHLAGRFTYGFARQAVEPHEIVDVDVRWDEGETSDNEDYGLFPRIPALSVEVILTDNSRVVADPGWVIAATVRNMLGLV